MFPGTPSRFISNLLIASTTLLVWVLPTAAQSPEVPVALHPEVLLIQAPISNLPIHAESGFCPDSVEMQTAMVNPEGIYQLAALVNTSAIATASAELIDTSDRFVIYAAPLNPEFEHCIGWVDPRAEAGLAFNIWMQWGYVYFRFDLHEFSEDNQSTLTYQGIYQGRPYIRWVVAD